jgi:hypothetical protein
VKLRRVKANFSSPENVPLSQRPATPHRMAVTIASRCKAVKLCRHGRMDIVGRRWQA